MRVVRSKTSGSRRSVFRVTAAASDAFFDQTSSTAATRPHISRIVLRRRNNSDVEAEGRGRKDVVGRLAVVDREEAPKAFTRTQEDRNKANSVTMRTAKGFLMAMVNLLGPHLHQSQKVIGGVGPIGGVDTIEESWLEEPAERSFGNSEQTSQSILDVLRQLSGLDLGNPFSQSHRVSGMTLHVLGGVRTIAPKNP